MPRFVCRYRGEVVPPETVARLAGVARVVGASGRNLLVDAAGEAEVLHALPDAEQWLVAAEAVVPAPPVPHPIVRQLRPPTGGATTRR